MQFTAEELCALLKGQLTGNPKSIITHPAKIEEAVDGAVSFIANPKYFDFAYTTKASVLVVSNDAVFSKEISPAIIRVENPYFSFGIILHQFNQADTAGKTGIEKPSFVADDVAIGNDVFIGAFSYIGNGVKLGNGVKIFPNVTIETDCIIGNGTVIYSGARLYRKSVIGNRCTIHSGVIIGSDGFGFAPLPDGSYSKVPQLGNVLIEDDVEIGSNTTIDRATMGSTIIRKGVKLDNLVQIAHNVEIGEHTVIAAQSGVSGSTKIGKHCLIGGQVGIVGHIEIADGSRINAQSGVSKSIKEKGKSITGSPAYDYTEALRSQVLVRRLPQMDLRIKTLEEKLNNTKHG